MKHKLKMLLREAWARGLYHTGLHRVVDRLMPQRLTILTSHCVAQKSNDFLPSDMKIRAETVTRLLEKFGRQYDWVNVGEGWQRLVSGQGKSMLVLAMDDGYQDNLSALLPLLKAQGVSATIYLESRPLAQGRLNWTHKFFWLLGRISHTELVEGYLGLCAEEQAKHRLAVVLGESGDLSYTLKKVLKYEAEQADVDRILTELFKLHGGDEEALCRELYLSWDDARALRDAGVEIGGHTVNHFVLSSLDSDAQDVEIADGKKQLERELGSLRSFAYPFGRHWDWNQDSVRAVGDAGFETATTTHAGTNTKVSDPLRLARWMIDDKTPVHMLCCEACGGFELLRKIGIDLSE
ncbi:MAG: peptidoglycan/xylan/chitin deacetylase (PgdA/CDA1 family) [Planctomycetota bacterium]|jgi:peptidoglycan/xylan/chitin deacetylase (PgdA/CDA1 family)